MITLSALYPAWPKKVLYQKFMASNKNLITRTHQAKMIQMIILIKNSTV
jgi:hypothetical protein